MVKLVSGLPPRAIPMEVCMGWGVEPISLDLSWVLDRTDCRILSFRWVRPAGSKLPPAIVNAVYRDDVWLQAWVVCQLYRVALLGWDDNMCLSLDCCFFQCVMVIW